MAGEIIDPLRRTCHYLFRKMVILSNCSLHIQVYTHSLFAVPDVHRKNLQLKQAVVNVEIHNWSKCMSVRDCLDY